MIFGIFINMRYIHKPVFVLLLIVFLISSCGPTYETVYPTLSDGKYDSEFPYRNCSEQLEDIAASLSKLDVLVFYRTYIFNLESKIGLKEIRKSKNLGTIASITDIYSESVGGTTMTIAYDGQRIAYLSCAHIVDYGECHGIFVTESFSKQFKCFFIVEFSLGEFAPVFKQGPHVAY